MTHTCKNKATARRGLKQSTDARRGHALLGFCWGAPLALLGSLSCTGTHKMTRQGNGQRRSADSTAHNKRRRERHEATRMPNKMKPNRMYMPAECGGVTTPPLLSIALRLQSACGKLALVASVAPGRCRRDSASFMHMIGRDQDARGRAHERRGGARYGGLRWAVCIRPRLPPDFGQVAGRFGHAK